MPVLQCSAGLVNTFVLRQQFEWALEGKNFDDDLWVGARGTMVLPTEAARRRTREMFERTSLFVVTLGLAEVWYQRRRYPVDSDDDDDSGVEEQVLWRAVPSDRFDPKRHGFRVSSVAENLKNLRALCIGTKALRPGAGRTAQNVWQSTTQRARTSTACHSSCGAERSVQQRCWSGSV